ncbi:hypothetical protein XENOCAPTIV_019892 [Xenoophorus captivus]|uniref:Uncharacterized protein n=1 Tax=Xenoophorus captivus TaxID=1517983 RepID=A0ABV0QJ77_9TELE
MLTNICVVQISKLMSSVLPICSELKNCIDKEDTKRELLGSERNVSDSLCIRCLQPFKFLVNSKRQCLDCRMFTCKSCSRYNKKEHGWVCDNCRMTSSGLLNLMLFHIRRSIYLYVHLFVRFTVPSDDFAENRMVRTRSLSKISSSVARQQYVDTSDEEEYHRYPPIHQQPHHRRKNSRASSQENLGQAPPVCRQMMMLGKSLFLEVKRSTAAALCDLTTEVLRTINATENAMVEYGLAEPIDRSPLVGSDVKQADDAFRELEEHVYITAGQSYQLETKLRRLEQSAKNRFGGTTDSELSELEDVVALTAARVQSAESEFFTLCLFAVQVSDIESKIAALSAKKKVSWRSDPSPPLSRFRCLVDGVVLLPPDIRRCLTKTESGCTSQRLKSHSIQESSVQEPNSPCSEST